MASPSENSNLLTYSLHSAGLKSQITFAGPDMANKSLLLEMSSPLSERDGTSIPLTRGHRELRLRPWLCVTACQPTRGPGGISQIAQGTMNFPSVSSLREHRHQYSISLSALAFNLWTGVTGWGEKGCRGGWMFLFKASLPRPTLSERCGKRLALFAESREKRAILQDVVAFWQLGYGRADTKQLCQKGAAPTAREQERLQQSHSMTPCLAVAS